MGRFRKPSARTAFRIICQREVIYALICETGNRGGSYVLSGPERRRRRTPAEKLQIVEDSLASAASVGEVACRHDVHPNRVTVGGRRGGRAKGLWGTCGAIEIAAGARILIPNAVDAAALTATVVAPADGRRR